MDEIFLDLEIDTERWKSIYEGNANYIAFCEENLEKIFNIVKEFHIQNFFNNGEIVKSILATVYHWSSEYITLLFHCISYFDIKISNIFLREYDRLFKYHDNKEIFTAILINQRSSNKLLKNEHLTNSQFYFLLDMFRIEFLYIEESHLLEIIKTDLYRLLDCLIDYLDKWIHNNYYLNTKNNNEEYTIRNLISYLDAEKYVNKSYHSYCHCIHIKLETFLIHYLLDTRLSADLKNALLDAYCGLIHPIGRDSLSKKSKFIFLTYLKEKFSHNKYFCTIIDEQIADNFTI